MQFVRLVALALVASSIVYVSISWYVRSVRRERLEHEWDAAHPDQTGDDRLLARQKAVEASVDRLRRSLPYRALWLIYVVPLVGIVYVIVFPIWS